MKKVLFWLFLALLCCGVASARPYRLTPDEQIKAQAMLLKGNSVNETVLNVKAYMKNNFMYEFHWRPQDARDTWRSGKADCTDHAILIKAMLDYIYKGKLDLRFMRGYCDNEKHDWLVLNKTIIIDNFYCYKRKTVGYGTW